MKAATAFTRMSAALLPAMAMLCVLGDFAWADTPSKLRIGLLPGEAALTVLRLNEPLRAYLEERLQMPVELTVGTDYAATGEALRFGRIDVAYLGPVTYVLGRERSEIAAFAKPMHDHGATFNALVIVPKDSEVKSLGDLRGTDIGFGDVASTSGHWVPRYMLYVAGLESGIDYKPQFLGSHDAVALAVARKTVAAGGLSEPILRRLVATGKISDDAIRILAVSPAVPEYTWTFRSRLDAGLRGRVRDAILAIEDPAVLELFKARSFVPAHDDDYQIVREWLRILRKEESN